jgi:Ca2+-binding EF-hand superfamily protein
MGCSNNVYDRNPNILKWKREFEAIDFKEREIKSLLKVFQEIDLNNDGSIELLELLAYLDIEKTPFTYRIFQIFDTSKNNLIDFGEFALALWNYCTLDQSSLGKFL